MATWCCCCCALAARCCPANVAVAALFGRLTGVTYVFIGSGGPCGFCVGLASAPNISGPYVRVKNGSAVPLINGSGSVKPFGYNENPLVTQQRGHQSADGQEMRAAAVARYFVRDRFPGLLLVFEFTREC